MDSSFQINKQSVQSQWSRSLHQQSSNITTFWLEIDPKNTQIVQIFQLPSICQWTQLMLIVLLPQHLQVSIRQLPCVSDPHSTGVSLRSGVFLVFTAGLLMSCRRTDAWRQRDPAFDFKTSETPETQPDYDITSCRGRLRHLCFLSASRYFHLKAECVHFLLLHKPGSHTFTFTF